MNKSIQFKRNIVLVLLVCSLTVFCVAAMTAVGLFVTEEKAPPAALPLLVVEPNRIDFQGKGEGQDEKHESTVQLINQSDRTINLLFAESSCRCSVAELPADTILPGEKLLMRCTLSTAGRISDRAGGEIWIAYRFADANEEEEKDSPMYVRLILTAVVEPASTLN